MENLKSEGYIKLLVVSPTHRHAQASTHSDTPIKCTQTSSCVSQPAPSLPSPLLGLLMEAMGQSWGGGGRGGG